jgi:hypothetical protein
VFKAVELTSPAPVTRNFCVDEFWKFIKSPRKVVVPTFAPIIVPEALPPTIEEVLKRTRDEVVS